MFCNTGVKIVFLEACLKLSLIKLILIKIRLKKPSLGYSLTLLLLKQTRRNWLWLRSTSGSLRNRSPFYWTLHFFLNLPLFIFFFQPKCTFHFPSHDSIRIPDKELGVCPWPVQAGPWLLVLPWVWQLLFYFTGIHLQALSPA